MNISELQYVSAFTAVFLSIVRIILNHVLKDQMPYHFSRIFNGLHQIDQNQKMMEALDLVKNKNLRRFYKDRIEKEVFEKTRGIKFYTSNQTKHFIRLYPEIQKKFNYEQVRRLRSHLIFKKGKLKIMPKWTLILLESLYLLMIAVLLIAIGDFIYQNFSNEVSFIFLIAIFVAIGLLAVMAKYDRIKKAEELRKVLDEIQKS